MENIMTITTTVENPSRLIMPTQAAFGPDAALIGTTDVYGTGTGVCVIERDRVSTKGHLGLAQAFVPGPRAWSPPSS